MLACTGLSVNSVLKPAPTRKWTLPQNVTMVGGHGLELYYLYNIISYAI